MKKIINIILIFIIPFIICGCNSSKKGNEEDIKKLLNNSIDERYEIISHVQGDGNENDIYEIYLPESDITATAIYSLEYNDAVNKHWVLDFSDYYVKKFNSVKDKREELRNEKYPNINENIIINNNWNNVTLNLYVSEEYFLEELYNYLIDCYKLNNFKYYNCYHSVNTKYDRYWVAYDIEICCNVGNAERYLYFSDLRKERVCSENELNNFISFEEFEKLIYKKQYIY